ncbi:MAG: ATP-binding cassette domain-containing protein, partial [Longicatena sp.]
MSITFKQVEHTYNPDSPFSYAALKGIDLDITEGKVTAVIGETGSGKSTLLNMIGGLDIPSEGTVIVDGNEISKMKDEDQTIFRRR